MEIYLHLIRHYVSEDGLKSEISFRQLVKLAYNKNYDIVIGWKRKDAFPEVNPLAKDKPQKFKAGDQLIVVTNA